MHLFAKDRPTIGQNVPALLIDGNVVPRVIVQPIAADTFRLMVMLHHYDKHGGFGYHMADVTADDIGTFFQQYMEDPELTLERYFGWKPQRSTFIQPMPSPSPSPSPTFDHASLL